MLDNTRPEAYLPPQVNRERGERVRILRNANGLSQGDLAQMLDVPRSTISKWENGVYNMTQRDVFAVLYVIQAWKDRKTRKVG